ncbi:hypothetical protein [Aromatoleum toluclasticum]|uniref:hypothetical protein n=1 Tax=Aromatoleum toluclasticum TaxID=92003 RepID=UPI00037A080A|nr:hypothetical protein [Aromatoleum toluclasticum]
MEIEYLEYDCEVIDLNDDTTCNRDPQTEEAAEAVFAGWFTDLRNCDAPGTNMGAN